MFRCRAWVLLKISRLFRPTRAGRFYSLFLTVAIIVAIKYYIQMVAHINLPMKTTLQELEDTINLETLPVKFFTTRGSIKKSSEKSKTVRGVQKFSKFENQTILSFNTPSSQVQEILRLYNAFVNNRALQNISHYSQHLSDSDKYNYSESLVRLVIPINGSDVMTPEKIPKNITAGISLNSIKIISVENEIPEISDFGTHLLPVNISRTFYGYNISFMNEKHVYMYRNLKKGQKQENKKYFYRIFTRGQKHEKDIYRNLTKVRRSLRSKNPKRPNYCPLWPDELVGPIKVDQLINLTEIPKENLKWIIGGGMFKPPNCEPRERTAIIIPYRDREKILMVLLRHLHTVLQRQKLEYGIFVIEMAYPTQFNRGLLANVGFLTALSIAPYTCYIIHDVDLLMQDDRNLYRCGRVPRHLTASNSKFNNTLPYLAYFGGVEAFTPDQYWKVNGFSNLYFGWGGEDDDMVKRIFHTDQHFSRPHHQVGGFVAIEHGNDYSNPKNPHRDFLLKSAQRRMKGDGVKSVMYNRLALEFKPLFTWVYVAAKEAKIMEKYQIYLG